MELKQSHSPVASYQRPKRLLKSHARLIKRKKREAANIREAKKEAIKEAKKEEVEKDLKDKERNLLNSVLMLKQDSSPKHSQMFYQKQEEDQEEATKMVKVELRGEAHPTDATMIVMIDVREAEKREEEEEETKKNAHDMKKSKKFSCSWTPMKMVPLPKVNFGKVSKLTAKKNQKNVKTMTSNK